MLLGKLRNRKIVRAATVLVAMLGLPAAIFASPLSASAAAPAALVASTTLSPAHQAQRAILGTTDHTMFQQIGTVRLKGETTAIYCWYDVTAQRYVGFNHTSGTQIPTNSSCIGTFTREDGVSAGGTGWYEYKSQQSGYCAKLDPNISGDPVVSYTCEFGTSTATEQEEHWADPQVTSMVMSSYYNPSLFLCMEVPYTKLSACSTHQANEFVLD